MLAELLQPTHLIIVAALLVLLFGGRWFANLGNGFRDAVRNFRHVDKISKNE
jgi:Sec-independent protein translocase protein TatA